MSNQMYDDNARHAPVAREASHYPPPPPAPYPREQQPWGGGYGYGGGHAPHWMRRRHGSIETKPFYLTSEFLVSLLASIALAISAATMHAFGGWRGWILITAIVCSYNLSRGIAKCGTRSRAYDPREDMQVGRGLTHGDGRHDFADQETRVTAS